MSMTLDQVDVALGDFILRAMGQDGGFRIVSNPVVNTGADTIAFKIAVPHGDPLSGVGETLQTVTLTVAIS